MKDLQTDFSFDQEHEESAEIQAHTPTDIASIADRRQLDYQVAK
jgi:hypothetical protein